MKFYLTLLFAIFSFMKLTAQDDNGLSFKPQFYLYASHDNETGDNFLSDAHKADFLGIGFQVNFIKFQNFKFGLNWEFREYEVTDVSKIGVLDNTYYYSGVAKFQYEYRFLSRFALEPSLGIGATRIVQNYDNSWNTFDSGDDDIIGLNLNAGLLISYHLSSHFAVFTGFNYNHINFDFDTPEKWNDYFNKVSLTQINLGIIISVGKN